MSSDSMPRPDDEEGDKFWKKIVDRLKMTKEYMLYCKNIVVRTFEIIKKMYENKELNRDGKPAINQTLLALALDELKISQHKSE